MAAPTEQPEVPPRPKRGRPKVPVSEQREAKRQWRLKRRKQIVYISQEMERWISLRNTLGLEDKDNPVVAKYLLDLYSNITKTSLIDTTSIQPRVGFTEDEIRTASSDHDYHRRKRIEDIASRIKKKKQFSDSPTPLVDLSMAGPVTVSPMPISSHILFKELDSESIITVARYPEIKLTNDKRILETDTAMSCAQGPWQWYHEVPADSTHCMMTGLYKLWQVNKYLDAVLVVNRHRVAMHRIILIGASPLLSSEFGEEPVHEMNEYRFEIDDTVFHESTLVSLLRYLYTGMLVCNPLQVHALHRLAGLLKLYSLIDILDKVIASEKPPVENGVQNTLESDEMKEDL